MTAGHVPKASGRRLLAAVSWLDWKLGARMLLKHPALTIIGGLSLAAAIAIGVVGIELADELLYKRLPFDEGSRVVRLETQDVAASRAEGGARLVGVPPRNREGTALAGPFSNSAAAK